MLEREAVSRTFVQGRMCCFFFWGEQERFFFVLVTDVLKPLQTRADISVCLNRILELSFFGPFECLEWVLAMLGTNQILRFNHVWAVPFLALSVVEKRLNRRSCNLGQVIPFESHFDAYTERVESGKQKVPRSGVTRCFPVDNVC